MVDSGDPTVKLKSGDFVSKKSAVLAFQLLESLAKNAADAYTALRGQVDQGTPLAMDQIIAQADMPLASPNQLNKLVGEEVLRAVLKNCPNKHEDFPTTVMTLIDSKDVGNVMEFRALESRLQRLRKKPGSDTQRGL